MRGSGFCAENGSSFIVRRLSIFGMKPVVLTILTMLLLQHIARASLPKLGVSAAAWRADLEVVRTELPKRHINAFHAVSREAFDATITNLEARAVEQDADARFVGLLHAINLIGDGHTTLRAPADRAYLPIEIQKFGDDLRVTRTAPGFERALATRVLSIGGLLAKTVLDRALDLTPRDENPPLREALAASYLSIGLILHGLGVIPNRARAVYTLQSDSGDIFDIELPSTPSEEKTNWVKPYPDPTLAEQHPELPFRCAAVDANTAVYCNFRAYNDLHRSVRSMLKLLQTSGAHKLVIDLRQNGGGDYTVGERELIRPLQHLTEINRKSHLFVLIGARTFSAAMNNAAQFRTMTDATLVGETIGEKPNSYQEPRELSLPNSHLVVRYSTRWYAFVSNGPNEVSPDVRITPEWDQYTAGLDPVLQYALSVN
jgi:hypothetical protein